MLRMPDYDDEDYPYSCDHCMTPIDELGWDPTGSRRCDDLDPTHRYHAGTWNLDHPDEPVTVYLTDADESRPGL